MNTPFAISIWTALISSLISLILGLGAAYFVFRNKKFRYILDGIFTLPLVLPPTVLGFFLLIIFGLNSPLGQVLKSLGINVIFTRTALVLAGTIVSFPLMYKAVLSSFDHIDQEILDAAKSLGVGEKKAFFGLILPLARPGIFAGLVLSFARVLGEFGASMMIAGNIPGKTQTMATAIYSASQAGDRETAFKWAGTICLISLVSILLLNIWDRISWGEKDV